MNLDYISTQVEQQRNYFNQNNTKPLKERIFQIKKLRDLIKEHETELQDAIYDDFGKSAFEVYGTELSVLYNSIKDTLKNLRRWAAKKNVATNMLNFPARSYIIPEPLGVCLVIGAWNYPYILSLDPVICALAAGNTVILKPSEVPSRTSAIMAKIINENFDAKYFTVIEGGIEITTETLKQKFDKIFFTGSPTVGKIVYQAAAKHLTPVTLELGGKSPAIITEDANMKMTVKRLVWGKFINAGQTCIAPDYVLVHESRAQEFLEKTKKEILKADYAIKNGNYVSIINTKNTERIARLIDTDKVYFGGNYNIDNRYIEPTLLENIRFDDAIMQEEIFGPVLPVISYTNLDEALVKVKQLDKPLSLYVFSSSAKTKKKIFSEISFGGGCANDTIMHISNPNLPFGGVGNSGQGSYHGEAGFKTFSHYKSILDKPTWLEFTIKYSPYTSLKKKLIKLLMD